MAAIPYSLPIDGKELSFGPFPFAVKGVTIVNASSQPVTVTDDRGIANIVKLGTIVSYPPTPTQYLRAKLASSGVAGDSCTVYVHDEPVPITSSGLAISGGAGTSLDVIALASFPPLAPADGDTHWLELPSSYDPIGGKKLRWLVTYDSANGMWLVTGPPLYSVVETSENLNSGVYGSLATAGPSVTLPRAGDYDVLSGCSATQPANNTGDTIMSYSIGGAGAVDADGVGSYGGTNGGDSANSRVRRKTGLGAGVVLTAQYKWYQANNAQNVGRRFLAVYPVRIT